MLANTASIDRRVAWLELFLDLVYVILLSKLAVIIASSHTYNVLFNTAVSLTLFLIIWQCWITHMLAININEKIANATRIHTWLHMLGIIWITLIIDNNGAFINNYANHFIVAFIFCRLTVFSIYLVVFNRNKADITYFKKVAKDAFVPIAIFASSLFFPSPYKYIIWYISLFIYYATPILKGSLFEKVGMRREHLIERLGGFAIIIMGESLWSIAKHTNNHPNIKPYLMLAGFELILVFSIFFYYYCVMRKVAAEKSFKKGPLLIYLHIMLYIGLILFSAPLSEIFNAIYKLHVCWCSRMLVIGVSIIFVTIDLIYLTQVTKRLDKNIWIYARIALIISVTTLLVVFMQKMISLKILILIISLIATYVVAITTRRGW